LQPNKGKQIIFPKSIINENVFVGNEKYFMPKKRSFSKSSIFAVEILIKQRNLTKNGY
jgi:hypothetical protein